MICDVLVIGAGVMGLSSAYHLKRLNPGKRVVLIERLGAPGQGSTAKSAGGYRNLLLSGTNRLLAEATIEWLRHIQTETEHDVKMHNTSYLYLLGESQYGRRKPLFEELGKAGVGLKTYDTGELKALIPDLVTDFGGDEEAEMMGLEPIEIGVQGLNCGSVDTDSLSRCLEALFLGLGGEVHYNTSADRLILGAEKELDLPGEPFVWQGAVVKGAETSRGEIRAETTVVAAGVWSERLLDPVGFDSMTRPKKRCMFVFKDPGLERLLYTKGFNEEGVLPVTQMSDAGVYLKAEASEGSLWLGVTEDLGRGYGLEDDPQAEMETYADNAYHALVKYLPCFEGVRPVNSWAGQRAINRFDKIPVVEGMPGLIYVGGATGNGIMKCESLGRVVAAHYAGEEEAELYGGRRVRVSDISVKDRRVEKERF
ncbi:MAG: FAD-binding oxidoreductase [Candidatus Bathyarchaeota archaeon]|nr:FAD-binding oxidoreductase [Candidatus Bathyarchaeota archaeon]